MTLRPDVFIAPSIRAFGWFGMVFLDNREAVSCPTLGREKGSDFNRATLVSSGAPIHNRVRWDFMLLMRVNALVEDVRIATGGGYNERQDGFRKAAQDARTLCANLGRAQARDARPALFAILEMPLSGTCAPECCDASWVRAIQIAAKCEMLVKWRSVDPAVATLLSPRLVADLIVPHSRRIALAAMELIERSPEASNTHLNVVVSALEHPRWQVVECAARTLGNMGLTAKNKALENLTKQLRHPQWQVRRAVAKALGRMIQGKYKPLEHAAEHDKHPAVRYVAGKSIGLKRRDS